MNLEGANLPLALEACDASALRDLLAQRGEAALDVDAAHELLGSLIELRDAEEGTGRPGDQSGLLFRSAEAGGVTLYSPTLAARIALQTLDRLEFPEAWAEYPEEYVTLCAGWILAHGRDPDALARWRPETAQLLVETWARRLACTSHELSQAVADLTGNGYPPMEPDAPSRKKGLARPTRPRFWSVWRRRFRAARASTGSIACLRRMFTGCAGRLRSALASWSGRRTRPGADPTTPASTPASDTSGSGSD